MSANPVRLFLSLAAHSAIRTARARKVSTAVWLLIGLAATFGLAVQAQNTAQNVVVLVGLALSFVACRIRMLRIGSQVTLGWPASLALTRSARFLIIWCQAAGPVVLMLTLTALLAWLLGADFRTMMFALIAIFIAGILAGLWSNASAVQHYPESRYRRSRPEVEAGMSLKPIKHDLHAFVAFKMRPEVLAKAAVPFLLVLPNQVSIEVLLMLMLLIPALFYASFLMNALPEFFRLTRSWLSSTPVSFHELRRLIRRSLWLRFGLIGIFTAPMLINVLGPGSGLLTMILFIAILTLWLEAVLRGFLVRPV